MPTTTYDFEHLLEVEGDAAVDYLDFDDPFDEEMDDLFGVDELDEGEEEFDYFLSARKVNRAVRLNRRYARRLGWQKYRDRIVRLLRFTNDTTNKRAFAQAVARWQRRQGLTADGIIGPNTWRRMRIALRLQPSTPETIPSSTDLGRMPRGPFGTLTVSAPGFSPFSYTFTPEDVLWIARFIVGEAGGRADRDNQAVIWAMFNRYALFTHRRFPTFHQFIQAYSTPLQPVLRSPGAAKRHMHKSSFKRTGGYYKPPHHHIPRGQLQRHLQLQRRPWSNLPRSARWLAEQAVKGQISNPIGNASEFASTRIFFRSRYGREPNETEWQQFTRNHARRKGWQWIGLIPGLNQRKNAFFLDRRAFNLPRGAVRVVPPSYPLGNR